MALCNPGNQYIPLIAGIAQEAAPVTYRLMAEDVGSALSRTLASPPTVRWSSADRMSINGDLEVYTSPRCAFGHAVGKKNVLYPHYVFSPLLGLGSPR